MVMLFQNLQPKNDHVNGARYIVEKMTKTVLYLKIATGNHKEKHLILSSIPSDSGDDEFPISGFKNMQLSDHLRFAIKTNKVHGNA